MTTLPENIDGSYPDASPGDRAHQQHHDVIHAAINGLSASYVSAVVMRGAGIDPTGGTDSAAAIQAKIDSLGANGGMVYFPPGLYRFDTPLNVDDTNAVTFVGPGSGVDREKEPACELRYQGTGTTPAISGRRTQGFTIQGMAVRYGDPAFTGRFIDVRGDTTTTPTYAPRFIDCLLGGRGGATVNAETVVDLGDTVEPLFQDCVIARAVSGIIGYDGAATFCFAFRMHGGRFVDMGVDAVRNPHGSWAFYGTVFENATDGTPAGVVSTSAKPVFGMKFFGGGFYDASQPGTWLDLWGSGVALYGTRVELAAGITAITLNSDTGQPFQGLSLNGAEIAGPSGATFLAHNQAGTGYAENLSIDTCMFFNGVIDNSASVAGLRYGQRRSPVVLPSTTYTASATIKASDGVVYVDATAGNITLTMPDALDPVVLKGAHLTVKRIDATANTVLVQPSGGQRIDGGFGFNLNADKHYASMVSDAAPAPGGWRVIAQHPSVTV